MDVIKIAETAAFAHVHCRHGITRDLPQHLPAGLALLTPLPQRVKSRSIISRKNCRLPLQHWQIAHIRSLGNNIDGQTDCLAVCINGNR